MVSQAIETAAPSRQGKARVLFATVALFALAYNNYKLNLPEGRPVRPDRI